MENTEKNNQEELKVMAKVNNKEIRRKDLEFQMQRIARIQGFAVPEKGTEESKRFEENVLNQMINDILIMKDADDHNFEPKEEEVDARYSVLSSQIGGEEKMKEAFQKMGITEEQLRKDLKDQIKVEQYLKYIKEKNEINVTEQEIKDFFEKQVVPQNPDIKLETVEPRIRQMLEQEKLAKPLTEIIQNLRNEAEITISL